MPVNPIPNLFTDGIAPDVSVTTEAPFVVYAKSSTLYAIACLVMFEFQAVNSRLATGDPLTVTTLEKLLPFLMAILLLIVPSSIDTLAGTPAAYACAV